MPSRRQVILFLAANPAGSNRLAFEEECAAIERELRSSRARDDFHFYSKWAVTIDELMRHLNELRPTVIHFSGHGCRGSSMPATRGRRNGFPAAEAGIYLQDEQGQPQLLTTRALRMMLKATTSSRVLILNACFSAGQARKLHSVVECVVGMTGAIRDEAARAFSVGFYRALGDRRSIGNAVEQAVATMIAKQLSDARMPRCRTRRGINAGRLFLSRRMRG